MSAVQKKRFYIPGLTKMSPSAQEQAINAYVIDQLNRLQTEVGKVKASEEFQTLLKALTLRAMDSRNRLSNYSALNRLLIYLQCPHARGIFHSLPVWNRDHGARILKGAHPVWYRRPNHKKIQKTRTVRTTAGEEVEESYSVHLKRFRWIGMYDITQTTKGNEDLPAELDQVFHVPNSHHECLPLVKHVAAKLGFTLRYEEFLKNKAGHVASAKPTEIVLNAARNITETISTILHEMTHVLAGHTADSKERLPVEVQELEAEAVSYLILAAVGIPSKGPEYLALYQREHSLLASLTRITDVFTQIYTELIALMDGDGASAEENMTGSLSTKGFESKEGHFESSVARI
ncbi:MAG: hypothetical protein ACE5OZ_17145 [Candidatus Heimdallarchaeota archaeon]